MAINPRLAIGASWTPAFFDKSGILNLSYGDPGVSAPGPLVRAKFDGFPVPIFDVKLVANIFSPKQHKRTGYGSKLCFPIELLYETVASGFLAGAEGTDAALFALQSLLGTSAAGSVKTAGNASPPYLFLTTTYQMAEETWIPVEFDPDSSIGTASLALKTLLRGLPLQLVSRQTYQDVLVKYIPSYIVTAPVNVFVNNTTAPPVGVPPFNGSLGLSSTLPSYVNIGDVLLVNFTTPLGGGNYVWYRFTITAIDGARIGIQFTSMQSWPMTVNFPVTAQAPVYVARQDPFLRTPQYTITPVSGSPPAPAFTVNLPITQLIGATY